ncbi:MAG: glycosyl hydrolase family 18 protein, partial [Dehalobacterium sp.]
LKEMAKRDKTLCHRQFAPGHGLISGGTINMLCWDHCAYGVQVSDLIYFMQKTMPSFDWNYHVGEQIIKTYHYIKPLLPEEVMTLGAALMFPASFVKLVEKFLLGKMEENKVKAKIEQMKEGEEIKTAFVEQLFKNHDLKGFYWGENSLPLSNAWYLLSSKDLRQYAEKKRADISSLLVQIFTVSAQGRLQEEPDKEKQMIAPNYQMPIFPVVYTSKNPIERDNVLQVLADDCLRDRLLDEFDKVLKTGYFSGVNINFEVCSGEEMVSFNKFIKSLSQIAHENEKLLLVSVVAAKGENLFYDYEYLGKYCDYLLVEIMDEDISCPGSQVSKEFIQAAIIYALAYLPKEKIVAVLPVHGDTPESVFEKSFLTRQFGIAGCAFWRLGLEDQKIWNWKSAGGLLGKKLANDEDEED